MLTYWQEKRYKLAIFLSIIKQLVPTEIQTWWSKSVTYAMLRHLGDVVENHLVRVTGRVLRALALVVGDGTDNSGVGVLEAGVSSEISSFLLICVFFSHRASRGVLVIKIQIKF